MNGNVSYTRSLSKRSRLSFEYRINYTDNSVERNTFVLTKENVFPDERNPRQSTEYDYAYLTHRIGSTYQYYFKKTKIAGTLHYQHAAFSSDYAFPYARKTETSFDNLTYSVVANINVNRNNTLKFNASGRTSNPRATDLQDIVNTTKTSSPETPVSTRSTPTAFRASTSGRIPPKGAPSPSRRKRRPAPTPSPTRW